jgi:primosomal protein N' (replication factor Y)
MENHHYCDVSLPVPLDQTFTYALPETLRHRVKPGCRVVVPFGARKLTGVVLACHNSAPQASLREALRLLDSEPVLGPELLALGKWIAGYYCAPLGEVLRGMLPLASEIRRGKVYSLTDAGRDAARQLVLGAGPEDVVVEVLRMLERRPVSASYLLKKLPLAEKALRSLERKGFVIAEQVQTERDPLRAPSEKLRVEALAGAPPPERLPKAERELLAFLELHPGTHNLKDVKALVKNASGAARSLARRKMVKVAPEPVAGGAVIRCGRGTASTGHSRRRSNGFGTR